MTEKQLNLYDRLINEPSNDWDIYYWATGTGRDKPHNVKNRMTWAYLSLELHPRQIFFSFYLCKRPLTQMLHIFQKCAKFVLLVKVLCLQAREIYSV